MAVLAAHGAVAAAECALVGGWPMTHEVQVLCNCTEDPCRTELYVSDVRIAQRDAEQAREQARGMYEALMRHWEEQQRHKPKLLLVV